MACVLQEIFKYPAITVYENTRALRYSSLVKDQEKQWTVIENPILSQTKEFLPRCQNSAFLASLFQYWLLNNVKLKITYVPFNCCFSVTTCWYRHRNFLFIGSWKRSHVTWPSGFARRESYLKTIKVSTRAVVLIFLFLTNGYSLLTFSFFCCYSFYSKLFTA